MNPIQIPNNGGKSVNILGIHAFINLDEGRSAAFVAFAGQFSVALAFIDFLSP